MNGKKINGIGQIVRLRQLVKKWRALALTRKPSHSVGCALSPRFKQRSAVLSTMYDSDEDCPACPPPDVPEGNLAVYVGRERRRFIIPTCYLSRPVFRTLLQKAEEEFGFDHKGGLTIPCETAVFERVLWLCERNDPAGQKVLSLDDLSNIERESVYCGSQAVNFADAFVSSKALTRASLQKSFG